MADNIKYIRWAAGVMKIVMVINIILGLIGFVGSLLVPVGAALNGNATGMVAGFTINFGVLISIVVNAFLTYTAARALELLADIAYHLLRVWHQQITPNH